ncbi:PQQ-dependent sugar dehydrogenase [Nocardioides insulae]|uniref:PQQ-dependent sugar dehydrogenase n=1 Tax=Nocardioides insulae TaxID=394734 RepID=UPI000426C08E|nr:PQQ-dependent sugar dehydrogenase [Nocardioides insulae]
MRRIVLGGAAATLVSGLLVLPLASSGATASAAPAPPPDNEFQKVTLNDRPGEPMDLAVLPDGDVLHTTRAGQIWRNDASSGLNKLAGTIDVYRHDEEGLQSIALDPEFEKNKWVYLYYSPPQNTPVDDPATPDVNEGDAPSTGEPADFEPFKGSIQLSRFKYRQGEVDIDSEQQIMQVPVDRGRCCHVGGDIVFDSVGNLILSTGDDTDPFESDGYAPLDDSEGRAPTFDARRSAGNTNDLRGKLLRIKPRSGGGYTIPKGNLFKEGTPKTRPEIYAMGLRNPFRIEIDPYTDAVYVADYSPDASSANPDRGPAGQGKWTVVNRPANYGWPLCATAELPYIDYDFATGTSGEPFDCAAPVNDSAYNTGLTKLPPVTQPTVWYSYSLSEEFPELETQGGIAPMAGPSYEFDPKVAKGAKSVAWPEYYDGMPLFAEWGRDYIKGMSVNQAGELSSIEPVLDSMITDNVMDIEFGPNGALYMLEYGDGYFSENEDAQLSRIDYVKRGNRSPVPKIAADVAAGPEPLEVSFSSAGTTDPDGDKLTYAWDFDADGKVDSKVRSPRYVYDEPGVYKATLTVTDQGGKGRGKHASADVDVVVGNQVPVVEFVTPTADQSFEWGDTVQYEVKVTDDQEVDCNRVTVTYVLGHDEHGHPQSTAAGCTGSLVTTIPGGHDPETDELHAVFVAEYTDPGEAGLPALTGSAEVALTPSH